MLKWKMDFKIWMIFSTETNPNIPLLIGNGLYLLKTKVFRSRKIKYIQSWPKKKSIADSGCFLFTFLGHYSTWKNPHYIVENQVLT